ncbi:MAG: HAMP domain-containing sensor histidine kinase [Cyanobacteria bacterium]|nr:HAMP domain-containing sensor histidine kinase [Cyanobacteriota bacterium]MDA0865783.1 HAMP domain-containing sensor histidine kinase [Cyanobacteriota bacterium]
MFQATRRQLALWYTTITAVVLLVFASGVYLYVRSTLVERVDDTLNHVVEIVERSLVIEPVADQNSDRILTATGVIAPPLRVNVEASFRDNTAAVEDDHIDLEWFGPNGTLRWSTLAAPFHVKVRPNPAGETVRLGDGQVMRQVTERVVRNHQVLGYLRVSHPWFEVTKPSRRLIWDLSLGSSAMVGVVALIGWLLSGIAMAPVRDSYQQLKQFTADASHELRNPIAVIQTNVQVALANPDPDMAEQQHQLQVIERITRRLGRLVDDLLFLARQDSGLVPLKQDPVDLAQLVSDVVEEQRAISVEAGVTLSQTLEASPIPSPSPWLTKGDHDQLTRLLTNLVVNGLQSTPAGGTVGVSLKMGQLRNQPAIQMQVQDTGRGMPVEAIPQIFDRFYRVDPARSRSSQGKGSGLGLAISKAIVVNHRGDIRLDSTPDQGTTVRVWLPAMDAKG